ncbi:MAG: hotdog domain-containing protein [Candidatus Xenobiia bacterium LiM19]
MQREKTADPKDSAEEKTAASKVPLSFACGENAGTEPDAAHAGTESDAAHAGTEPDAAQPDLEKISPVSTIEITVRYAETDQMGVVHHSVYPVYFEAGRTDFFSRHILPYSELERRGIWAPVIHFSCSLTGVAHYEDTLLIITAPELFTAARLSFSYRAVQKKSNETVARGSSTHTFISPERRILRLNRHPELFSLLTAVFPHKSI